MTQEKQIVIAFVKRHMSGRLGGYVLRSYGRWVEQEQNNQGNDLDDWLIREIPPASDVIMVWEGVCENGWCSNHGADWEPDFCGGWRAVTLEELQSLSYSGEQLSKCSNES